MDLRDFVADAMNRTRHATLNVVRDMTAEQLRWAPAPGANSTGFLLFHAFRAEDMYFHSALSKAGEIWERDGWVERWRLPSTLPPDRLRTTTGNSWTAEEVASWQVPPLAELLAYGQAVRDSALKVLQDLDLSRLSEVPRPNRPDMTVAGYLFLASHHESQHLGQMDYLAGLMRG
jgi:hypothetical protein